MAREYAPDEPVKSKREYAPEDRPREEGFTLSKVPGEALSNLESFARGGFVGTVAGVPAIAGIPGTIEQVGRAGLRKAGVSVSPETVFPTMGEIYEPIAESAKAVLPRATTPTREAGGFEQIGETVGLPVPSIGAATTVPKVAKGVEKTKELVSRARGKPLEQALGTMTTSIEDIAKAKTAASQAKEIEQARKLTSEQARRGVAQRSVTEQLTTGAERVKQQTATDLHKIAKPSSDYTLGTDLREKVIVPNEKQLATTVDRAAKVLKDTYFAEGKAKEKAGDYWSRSTTGSEFMRYLRDVTNPMNAGKYNQYEISAARELYNDLATQFARTEFGGLKAIPSEIEKIEKVIRDTKKLPSKPTMTGADAMKQQYMGNLAQKLEDSVYGYVDEAGKVIEGFAPTGRVFRKVYAEMMKPLNAYESPVGKMASQRLEANKVIFMTDASELPAKIFQSPEQIRNLEFMDISKKTLEPYAKQYTANQLSKLNTAKDIDAWLKSERATYLQEFPDVLKKAQEYARSFAKNETEVAGKLESAKQIREFARRGGADLRQDLEKLRSASAEDRRWINDELYKVMNAKEGTEATRARTYVNGLKGKNLISREEADLLMNQIFDVEKQAKNKAAAIAALKGLLPFAAAVGAGTAITGYTLNRIIGGFNAP